MRSVNAQGAFGHGDEPEQQRRVVRAFWDVLWEWSYHPVIRRQYKHLFFEAAFGGGGVSDEDYGDESSCAIKESEPQDDGAETPIQVGSSLS